MKLGTVHARPGRVEIRGVSGLLWHLDIEGADLTPRDRLELTGAAGDFGHPPDMLLRAGRAAAKATRKVGR